MNQLTFILNPDFLICGYPTKRYAYFSMRHPIQQPTSVPVLTIETLSPVSTQYAV